MPYYRRYSSNPILGWFTESVVNQIILVNVIVFILELALNNPRFIEFFGLVPRLVVTKGYVWQLVTYMFLHGGFWHIALNMFVIYMFGSALEQVWGSDRFLRYYFICGLGAAGFSFIFSYNTTVIGASGAGYGILLAYAVLFPDAQIYVWGLFPIRARTLVIVLIFVELVSGLLGGDGIAHFAHLGGMLAGFLYLRGDRGFSQWWRRLRSGMRRSDRPRWQQDPRGGPDADTINAILDKISREGYGSLTENERRLLDEYSRKDTKH
jgi:membrane associated rhomboid family serine protease